MKEKIAEDPDDPAFGGARGYSSHERLLRDIERRYDNGERMVVRSKGSILVYDNTVGGLQ